MTPDHPHTTQLALFDTARPRPGRASDEETAPLTEAGHGFPDGALEHGETLSPTWFEGGRGMAPGDGRGLRVPGAALWLVG
ncbi:hypothetical protein ACFZAV_17250 [Streptomyces sp. NPDC008343]|uniref:hypothetical protein n=1 Tax=Streptomyces sp. NPDC008343 TaxID=3364828 RepID=UPI0036F1219A